MISLKCFQLPWLQAQKARLGARDLSMLERCIHALELVDQLQHAGLDFVFKGGTSLVLHLQPLRRLSIDVDIACTATLTEIKRALDEVIFKGRAFTGYEHQEHRDRADPTNMHFKVMFDSLAQHGTQSHILLDVLNENAKDIYPALMEKDLAIVDFVETDAPAPIRVPAVDCLLGDKLTAFAPLTIGVLRHPPENRAGEPADPTNTRVAKQLYDVSELFAVARDLGAIRCTYETIHAAQNRYRKKSYTLEDTLRDTIDAAFWFSQRDVPGGDKHHDMSDFINEGILRLNSHLIGNKPPVLWAKAAAARAACLAAMLLGNSHETLDEIRANFRGTAVPSEEAFTGRHERLRHLSKTAPEAFYYWHIACGYLA